MRSQTPQTCSLCGGTRVLEIGCGEGLPLGELAPRGFQVSGVESIEIAREAARQTGLSLFIGYFSQVSPPAFTRLFQPLAWRTIEVEYSSLIHNENVVTYLAGNIPTWLDQFHLLAVLPT